MPFALRLIDRERAIVRKVRAEIEAAARVFLERLAAEVVAAVQAEAESEAVERDQKAKKHAAEVAAEKAEYAKLEVALRPKLEALAKDGARKGLLQVLSGGAGGKPPDSDELDELLRLANQQAIEWASDHAGELVTEIEEHTRDGVRLLTQRALEEGWSNDELAAELEQSGVFSPGRAEKIARTETAFADVTGNRIGWRESGVVEGKEWAIAQDEVCDACKALDGEVVDLERNFSAGVQGPPLHPSCRCDLLPVLEEE